MTNVVMKFVALDVSSDETHTAVVQAIESALANSDLAVYGKVSDEFETAEGFFAQSPYRALVWICRNMNKGKLVKAIQNIYDNPVDSLQTVEQEPDVPMECDQETAEGAASDVGNESAGQKRKRGLKEKSTREVNKALVEKMNLALAHTVASTQDWAAAKNVITLTDEQERYRRFAVKGFGRAGVQTVAQLIANAEAVGSRDAFLDWQAIISGWRRQQGAARTQFRRIAENRISMANEEADCGFSTSQIALSQRQDPDHLDNMGLTFRQRETFRYRLVDAQKSVIQGFAEQMRQRWKLDALYEESYKLEQEMRRQQRGTGARGVGYASIARHHLFGVAFEADDGSIPNKDLHPDLYNQFTKLLDNGRKWNIIKCQFGTVGIFGCLPQSIGANAWIERTDPPRVAQWAQMVAECNQDVMAIAKHVEPLYLSFIQGKPPPPEFLFLEHFDSYGDQRPLLVFERYVAYECYCDSC